MKGGKYEPQNVIDGKIDTFWCSGIQDSVALFELHLPKVQTVESINIWWKFPAKEFEVYLLMYSGVWKKVQGKLLVEDNKVDIKINNKEITGLRIIMKKYDDQINGMFEFNEKVYGIRDINIKTGSKKLYMRDCDAKEDDGQPINNRWNITDVLFVNDLSSIKINSQFNDWIFNVNKMLDGVNKLVQIPKDVPVIIKQTEEFQSKLKFVEDDLNRISVDLFKFSIFNFPNFDGQTNQCGLGGGLYNWGYTKGKIEPLTFLLQKEFTDDIQRDIHLVEINMDEYRPEDIDAYSQKNAQVRNPSKQLEELFLKDFYENFDTRVQFSTESFIIGGLYGGGLSGEGQGGGMGGGDQKHDVYRNDPSMEIPQSEIGSTVYNSSISCNDIIQRYPYKKSGFYYIQTGCSKLPIRVFCDFESNNLENQYLGYDYLYFGGKTTDAGLNHTIKNQHDIKYHCAKLGLYPVRIRNEGQLDNIYKYIKKLKLEFSGLDVIPIAFDYDCEDHHKCSKRFRSLDDSNTVDINPFVKKWLSDLKQPQENLMDQDLRYIGFTEKKPIYFNLQDYHSIKGIICSSNIEFDSGEGQKSKYYDKEDFLEIDCFQEMKGMLKNIFNIYKLIKYYYYYQLQQPHYLLKGHYFVTASKSQNYLVKCPKNCSQINPAGRVVGVNIYRDDSSICLSAIHNGVIKNPYGGLLELNVLTPQKYYESSEAFGVKTVSGLGTENALDPLKRSFIVRKHVKVCPMTAFVDPQNFNEVSKEAIAFIQTKEKSSHRSKNLLTLQSNNKLLALQDAGEDEAGEEQEQETEETIDAITIPQDKLPETFYDNNEAFKKLQDDYIPEKKELLTNLDILKQSGLLVQQMQTKINKILSGTGNPQQQRLNSYGLVKNIKCGIDIQSQLINFCAAKDLDRNIFLFFSQIKFNFIQFYQIISK